MPAPKGKVVAWSAWAAEWSHHQDLCLRGNDCICLTLNCAFTQCRMNNFILHNPELQGCRPSPCSLLIKNVVTIFYFWPTFSLLQLVCLDFGSFFQFLHFSSCHMSRGLYPENLIQHKNPFFLAENH
uniref:Uncharacterized protein n=1 Tax=Eutreptiella gymnastica TaxID=73025 RepID=A0A7S1IYA4_9EUGL